MRTYLRLAEAGLQFGSLGGEHLPLGQGDRTLILWC